MELGIKDRIVLLGILPEKGNLVTARMVADLRKKVGLTAEEIESAKVVVIPEKDQFTWENNLIKDIEFFDTEKELIIKCFKDLDERDALSFQDHVPIYDKFTENG